jgi:hypothetical protein
MKYSEINKDPVQSRATLDQIDRRWRGLSDALWDSEKDAITTLFGLNTGGLAAALAYLAAKGAGPFILPSIVVFASGVVILLIRTAWAYYRLNWIFRKYREETKEFFRDEVDWEVLIDRDSQRSWRSIVLEASSWASALCFVAALILGIYAIWH